MALLREIAIIGGHQGWTVLHLLKWVLCKTLLSAAFFQVVIAFPWQRKPLSLHKTPTVGLWTTQGLRAMWSHRTRLWCHYMWASIWLQEPIQEHQRRPSGGPDESFFERWGFSYGLSSRRVRLSIVGLLWAGYFANVTSRLRYSCHSFWRVRATTGVANGTKHSVQYSSAWACVHF